MKGLNWKNDTRVAWAMVAHASRGVGGKYSVRRREGPDGVWFEVEHLTCSAETGGWQGLTHRRVIHREPVARTYAEALVVAEADNDQRRAIKDRNAASACFRQAALQRNANQET
jgi:hypothetical protein